MALAPVIVSLTSQVFFAPSSEVRGVFTIPAIEATTATPLPCHRLDVAEFSHITTRDQVIVGISCGRRVIVAIAEPCHGEKPAKATPNLGFAPNLGLSNRLRDHVVIKCSRESHMSSNHNIFVTLIGRALAERRYTGIPACA
jgi:hypothetical protein